MDMVSDRDTLHGIEEACVATSEDSPADPAGGRGQGQGHST
jgi:hypothetical protein